jgi:hypothetical protein
MRNEIRMRDKCADWALALQVKRTWPPDLGGHPTVREVFSESTLRSYADKANRYSTLVADGVFTGCDEAAFDAFLAMEVARH